MAEESPSAGEARLSLLSPVLGAMLALGAWVGEFPALLAAFPLLIYQRSLWRVFDGLLVYYAVVSIELPDAVARYFGGDYALFWGWLLWLADAAVLAGSWVLVAAVLDWVGRKAGRRAASEQMRDRVAQVLFWARWPLGALFVSFGPVGLLHWADPLFGAGAWFPGLGALGLFLYLVVIPVIYAVGALPQRWAFIASISVAFALLVVATVRGQAIPKADREVLPWVLEDGEIDYLNTAGRLTFLANAAEDLADAKETLAVLPESYLGDYRPSIDRVMAGRAEVLAARGKTLLVGVDLPRGDGFFDNALIGFGADSGVVYRALTPMPLSWVSRSRPRNLGGEGEAVVRVAGKPTLFALCYEVFLFSHGFSAFTNAKERPVRMIAASNLWAVPNDGISMKVQRISLSLISSLLGIPVEWGYNASPRIVE